jgi:hypothetical protein
MRRYPLRLTLLTAVVGVLTWLLGTAAPATAGTYKVSACTAADRFNPQAPPTHAFADLSLLPEVQTGGLYMRRACARSDGRPFGMVAGNVLRSGRVRGGHQAGFVMDAPPGTEGFVHLDWSGIAKRRDCRYSLQMYALAADGSAVPVRRPDGEVRGGIRNFLANRNCARKDPELSYAQVAQIGKPYNPKPFALLRPAARIVQRAVCVGGTREGFCSARSVNRINTWFAEATVADSSPPSAAIVQDNPFTQGAWVSSGTQSVGYTASDNVGIKHGLALGAGAEKGRDDRPCDYTRTIPCTNDPGRIEVRTAELGEGSQPLVVRAIDTADNAADSQPVTVRVDRTAPAAPAVSVDGGEQWRSQNSFTAVWQNSDEGDRAPITAAHWRLCRSGTSGCTSGSQSGTGISRLADLRVPEPGEWHLRVVREDGAGNRNDDYASQPVTLRHDPEAPQLAFEPAPAEDPTRVSVAVTEKISGIAGGQIELSAAGSNTWQALATRLEGNRLVAHIDDSALPPGQYLARGQAVDLAGNVGVAAAPQPLTLPLRIQSTLQAGVVTTRIVRDRVEGRKGKKGRRGSRGRRVRRRVIELRPESRVRWGGNVTIAGRLTNRDGQGLPGQQIRVLGPGAGGEELLAHLTTDAQGAFSYRAAGSASRTLRLVHPGTATVLPAESRVTLVVPAAGSFKPSRKRLPNGGRVVFRGRVASLPLPAAGKLVELQVRQPSGEWTTFRTLRTDTQGRWAMRYRFQRTECHTTYRLRARIPAEGGYPFAEGHSRIRKVRVLGAQGPCP